MDHPTPPNGGWGKSLSTPDFVSNQAGHLGINLYTDPEFAEDMVGRANLHKCVHHYNDSHSVGE